MTEFFTFRRKTEERLIKDHVRASSFIPVLAFEEEENLFLGDDETLSFGFVCQPLTGADEKIQERVTGFLNQEYPPNTLMQIILYRSPDINESVYSMVGLRDGFNHHELLQEVISQRREYFMDHTHEKLIARTEKGVFDCGIVHDLKLFVTVKIPISGNKPSQADLDKVGQVQLKVKSTLDTIGVRPTSMTASNWVRLMSSILNWGPQTSWRADSAVWEKDKRLCDQVLDYDHDVEVSKEYLKFGDCYVKALSAKRLPEYMFFGDAISYAGDLSGGGNCVQNNYLICTNLIFPDPDNKKHQLERKRQFTINQASGAMVKFVPVLADKMNDFDVLYESMQGGKKPIYISYHMFIFGKTLKQADEAAMAARNYWRESRFEIMVDKFIQMPLLINCLPMCGDAGARMDLDRYKTVTTEQAAPILPMFGEWKGTGTPHMNLLSRNGQLMTFSLHDTGSNMNCVVAAQSGSGKSFAINELISSYMSEGAKVWVVDVGRSYEKLCHAYNGDFIHFGGDSDVCLNPFELIVSLSGSEATRAPGVKMDDIDGDDGEEDAIVGLLEAMAAPSEKLTDLQMSGLKRHVNKVWLEMFRDMSVDDVANSLLADPDTRISDIGQQLYSFGTNGAYGRYFNGRNNMQFDNQLTVLELEELKGRKHLQQVVLLQLIYQIQQEMYLGERNRKKVVVLDESWDLLALGDVEKFIISAFRRFRKYGGSCVVITQSVNDLYATATGRAIAENSATTCLLGQKSETVESLKRSGNLVMSDGAFEMLKTVHTIQGVYSEMFIKSEFGMGIGRLIVNDFQKLLYSTKAEDVRLINDYVRTGLCTSEAIHRILLERQQLNDREQRQAVQSGS